MPECIYRAPEPLGVGTSRVTTIKCMGLSARHTVVARLSPFVLRRGYLAWGHPQTGFAERVAACAQVSAEELERRMGAWWRRLPARVRCLVDQAFGLLQVEERLSRYPHEPLPALAFHAPVFPRYPSCCQVTELVTLSCHQGAFFSPNLEVFGDFVR